MKRKINILLVCFLMLSLILPHGLASESTPRIVDNAGLFTAEERSALEHKALSLRDTYEMDVVILTIDTLDGKRPQEYADDYFDEHNYGCGDNFSGLLFLLAMEERDWYISTCGDAIYAVTDYDVQQLGETAINAGLSDGEYYRAFDAYLDELPVYLEAFQNGTPIDGYADYSGDSYHGDQEEVVYYEKDAAPNVFLSLIIGFVAALVTVLIMRGSMNTRRKQYGASSYMKDGSFRLSTLQDMFLYSTVSKTARPQNHSNGHMGGGSSVHHSSGGRSHGGGGGKF